MSLVTFVYFCLFLVFAAEGGGGSGWGWGGGDGGGGGGGGKGPYIVLCDVTSVCMYVRISHSLIGHNLGTF